LKIKKESDVSTDLCKKQKELEKKSNVARKSCLEAKNDVLTNLETVLNSSKSIWFYCLKFLQSIEFGFVF
jgi:hypothetical protein